MTTSDSIYKDQTFFSLQKLHKCYSQPFFFKSFPQAIYPWDKLTARINESAHKHSYVIQPIAGHVPPWAQVSKLICNQIQITDCELCRIIVHSDNYIIHSASKTHEGKASFSVLWVFLTVFLQELRAPCLTAIQHRTQQSASLQTQQDQTDDVKPKHNTQLRDTSMEILFFKLTF